MNPALEHPEPPQDDATRHHRPKPANTMQPTTVTALLNINSPATSPTTNVPNKRMTLTPEPQTTSTLKTKHCAAPCRKSKPR